MDGMCSTKVFWFMDATEILEIFCRVDGNQISLHRKRNEEGTPLHFHCKNPMGDKAAKKQREEYRIEDAIGRYVECSLSCS